MKIKIIGISIAFTILISACVSIPKETVTLSQTLGKDLQILHNSHRNAVDLYYNKIKKDIDRFIDEVYAPFVIHDVLKHELKQFKLGEKSIYGSIQNAGEMEGKESADKALNDMSDFLNAANHQIELKRNELLTPINKQRDEIIRKVNTSYENAIYANSTITGYLQSIRKVKETQQEALSMIGLQGVDILVTSTLVNISDKIEAAVIKGKEIDIKSDQAMQQLEEITNQIKKITNKK